MVDLGQGQQALRAESGDDDRGEDGRAEPRVAGSGGRVGRVAIAVLVDGEMDV